MAVGTEEAAPGGEIVKARTDKREYRRIVLKNSLVVLLVSDPETDKCAASMNVGVGYLSDPEGMDGLAHFLEHLLFYASEKFPEEHSFLKYVMEHGGSANAYTTTVRTNYHFDVNTDCFSEALDRFSHFFIKPLMSADATMREIKAVDSENQKNLLSDDRRMRQLRKHLTREDYPYHKFSTGNMETLHVRPEARGIDTRSELLKFYDEHYSANIMHLVVYGKETLDKTQGLVEEMFKEIRNTNKAIPRFPGQPCTADHLQILVKAVPIKQSHKLRILWPVTPNIHHNEEAPCRYLGLLIGRESQGSLFHALKTLGWATKLFASEADWTIEYYFIFSRFRLFLLLLVMVIGLLFTYIQLLQQSGVSQWIFDELTLAGFIHKLRILLETVIQKIANFEVKPDRFSVIKETVTKAYQNYKFIQPNHQAKYYCSLVLQDQAWPWTEELDALSHLEAQDLAKSVPVMLSRTFLECYIAGNVEKNEAESMVGSNPSDENSALLHYTGIGSSR